MFCSACKFLLIWFNLCGVANFKYNRKKIIFESSRWILLKNLLFPFISFGLNILSRAFLSKDSLNPKAKDIAAITIFFSFVYPNMFRMCTVIAYLFVYMQIFSRNKTLRFLNLVLKFLQAKDNNYFKHLKSYYLRILTIAFTAFSSDILVTFFHDYNFNWQGVVHCLIHTNRDLVLFALVSLVTLFLSFFVQETKEFNDFLKQLYKKQPHSLCKQSQKLQRFIGIQKLFVSYNDSFSGIVTVLILFLTINLTLRV